MKEDKEIRIKGEAHDAEERVRVQPRASFQPPEHCADCAAGVPFGADGHHVTHVSERTRLIRERQRSGSGEVTAIMVSRPSQESGIKGEAEKAPCFSTDRVSKDSSLDADRPFDALHSEDEIFKAVWNATANFKGILNDLQRDQISVDVVAALRAQRTKSSEASHKMKTTGRERHSPQCAWIIGGYKCDCSIAAPTTTVPDHSQASLPESASSPNISLTLTEIREQAAANMKATLLLRVREKAAFYQQRANDASLGTFDYERTPYLHMRNAAEELATELEAIEVNEK